MRRSLRYLIVIGFTLAGLIFPRLVRVLSVHAQIDTNQSSVKPFIQSNATQTVTPTLLASATPTASVTGPAPVVESSSSTATNNLSAFIQAPVGHVSQPYVILSGFSAIAQTGPIGISGFMNAKEFICLESPCIVYLEGDSRVVFRSFLSATGARSDEVIASISVASDSQGYLISIDSVSMFTSFADSCSVIWSVRDENDVTWNDFVQFPYQLNTKKTLHTLAANLIFNGIVDASDCAYGGLNAGLNWPTACGLEKASDKMIEWQNQFDNQIWQASKDYGIPPKILKTLIEIESQFWPGNSRFYLDEYGLGQINELGVDVLLRKDPSVYQQICPGVIADCSVPYIKLKEADQALIRGALVQSVDTTCETCEYGLDLNKAKDSVALIANLVRANCEQVKDVVGKDISDSSYEDLWRFTLGTYHSGTSCFYDAVKEARDTDKDINWKNIDKYFSCGGGSDYVNGLMDTLSVFDYYGYQTSGDNATFAVSTFVPTKTPLPTSTPYVSDAVIKVQVYLDRNANGTPEDDEWVDNVSVLLILSNGEQVNMRTKRGVAVFDMIGFRPGSPLNVSLPGLYRSESLLLPEHGEVVITFKFDQPVLPTILP